MLESFKHSLEKIYVEPVHRLTKAQVTRQQEQLGKPKEILQILLSKDSSERRRYYESNEQQQ